MVSSGLDAEPIWAALFTLLRTRVGAAFVTVGRQMVQPPTLTSELQPALFLVQGRESYVPRPVIGAGTKVTLSGFIIIFLQTPTPLTEEIGSETELGATQLNALLKLVRGALAPDDVATGLLTLGGLVHHCWIEGDLDMDTGVFSQQGAAIVPVKMLVP